MNKSERNVIIKTVEKRWLSTLVLNTSPLLFTSITGGYWLPPVILQQKKLIFLKNISLPFPLLRSLSIGRLFNKLSFSPIPSQNSRIFHKSWQIDYTKPSQPVHFPTKKNFLTINVYLKCTEKMSCFGFQRPKVPVPEKKNRNRTSNISRGQYWERMKPCTKSEHTVCHWVRAPWQPLAFWYSKIVPTHHQQPSSDISILSYTSPKCSV